MKRAAAFLLIAALLFSLSACGRYRLISVPKELDLDVSALSEDTESMTAVGDATPLVAAIPEEKLYVYSTDKAVRPGVLVKYDKRIQYFTWDFSPFDANMQLYLHDYNADGRTDIAVTFCDTDNAMVHNENLHILLAQDKQFKDMVYTWETAATDATMGLAIRADGGNQFTAILNGEQMLPFTLEADDFGAFMGVKAVRYQDFTLGDTITVRVKPGLVFENTSVPVYDALECNARVVIEGDLLRQADLTVAVQS